MKPYITGILCSYAFGATTLALLSAAWAPSTTATYGSAIRRYFDFCEEHELAPLAATPAHMGRYVESRYHQGLESPTLHVSIQRFLQGPRPRSNCPRRLGPEGEKMTRRLTSRD
jgi:hypothetical protein